MCSILGVPLLSEGWSAGFVLMSQGHSVQSSAESLRLVVQCQVLMRRNMAIFIWKAEAAVKTDRLRFIIDEQSKWRTQRKFKNFSWYRNVVIIEKNCEPLQICTCKEVVDTQSLRARCYKLQLKVFLCPVQVQCLFDFLPGTHRTVLDFVPKSEPYQVPWCIWLWLTHQLHDRSQIYFCYMIQLNTHLQ